MEAEGEGLSLQVQGMQHVFGLAPLARDSASQRAHSAGPFLALQIATPPCGVCAACRRVDSAPRCDKQEEEPPLPFSSHPSVCLKLWMLQLRPESETRSKGKAAQYGRKRDRPPKKLAPWLPSEGLMMHAEAHTPHVG